MAKLSGKPIQGTRLDTALWVNRERELAALEQAVRLEFNAVVYGPRGVGKSSLARWFVRSLAGSEHRPVLVQGELSSDAAEFLALVRHRLTSPPDVASADSGTGPPRDSVLGREHRAAAGGARVNEVLLDLVDDIKGALSAEPKRLIVVDGLPPRGAPHTVFGRLRDELWELPLMWVVFADLEQYESLKQPPANAFFEVAIELRPLGPDEGFDLLRRRISEQEADDATVHRVVQLAEGRPRALIDLARERVLEGTSLADSATASARRRTALGGLGPSARRLVEELEAHGPASASDERLLKRLGWSRSRASQVLGALERAGVARATEERGRGGRPRKVFELIS